MKHKDYNDACERTEHKDMPAFLRNMRTGEVGKVIQCTGFDTPDAFLVQVGEDVTSWPPAEVEEVEGEA
ncbi:MAG: hypothetical protein C0617_03005 [Desulfuromonas sp.]|uniref:hypothetical protein n=1 Tax=Desulfuromonas sp. TaxID=892 RepID=UPI000CBA4A55|nr:hypothetical protein [Desulfuromonas sp.]PLX85668.1 MAG: hypothetical protein C0617_03005 [Desulfuromonas sp.]